MHILFLTDNFPPEVNAPASRTFEHCRAWVAAGHRVTVVTCAPNFPSGRVHPGYRNRLWSRETIEGVEVVRVWSFITANEGLFKRSLDYASYMVGAVLAAPFVRGVDIVVATSPQFFTACAGAIVAAARRKPFVFEVRDLWPESIRAVGALANEQVLNWLERLELFLYRRASAVVAVTHAFRDNLTRRGVDGAKIHVVTNGADLTRFAPIPRDAELARSHGLTDKFVAGYIGTHGMAHALDTLLEAAARLEAHPEGQSVRLLMLGDGATKQALKAQARAMGLTSVVFLDSVAKSEVARYWGLLDVSIIHLRKAELFATVIPSKLFEGMAMGVPVAHGVPGESAMIVEREGVGLTFESENADSLVEALLTLARDHALRAEHARRALDAAARYDRAVLADQMLAVLERVGRPAARFTPAE
ncbi:glycosyltransferase family 4 protein [Caulobacter sp. FWC2]|uniref:glycosyltransferase family 4 protein n=1 Tax=Caulobacter sp. FWC2 TaxID=69664 RepID=UPI000C1479BC|nr:glycosyltransferase family 4 protein [Caulobacter sp. FWC2]PIB92158.1 glycosyltransferase WbuB [Caulobacter sp. FWC2]